MIMVIMLCVIGKVITPPNAFRECQFTKKSKMKAIELVLSKLTASQYAIHCTMMAAN